MSRHRLVKKMNLADELDDDALSDGGEDDLTEEQQAQMNQGLERVRAVVGSEAESGLEDSTIKDALWNEFFDVDHAVSWLLEERDRRHAAMERRENRVSKELPPLPADFQDYQEDYQDDDDFYQAGSPTFQNFGIPGHEIDMDERPRVPLIVLAQQSPYPPPEPSDQGTPIPMRLRLSTITERSERTEASRHWPSKQQLYAHNDPQPSSPLSTNTSYGQVIDGGNPIQFAADYHSEIPMPVNPNEIPPSPSPSAQLRLSHYEPAPSVATSESRSSTSTPPRTPRAPLPPIETIPDIPDYKSKSTARPAAPVPPSTSGSVRQSKLSILASSRVSSATKSSRTPQPMDSASVITYPALRPSPESEQSLRSVSMTSASSVSTVKPRPQLASPASPPRSSTSSLVRRAIQTALELEAGDRDQTPQTASRNLPALSTDGAKPPSARSPTQISPSVPSPLSPTDSHTKGRPSKLALLAQAKASASAYQGPWMPKVKSTRSPGKGLPDSHTEYLTPIANGPTATTAITTSYQSLHSLKSACAILPALPVVPIDPPRFPESGTSAGPPKRSKLTMKVKKAHEKPLQDPSPVTEDFLPEMPPMFLPKTSRSRALPSAFASLLLDDHLIPSNSEGKDVHKDKGKRREDPRLLDSASSLSSLPDVMEKPRHRKHSRPQSFEPPVERFAFDVPSPDDVVLNARRGTSLAQRR